MPNDLLKHPFFKDRKEAGVKLAEKLQQYRDGNSIILALPRGGVVVGYEISKILNIPLNIVVVRKIGAPRQPEFGIGAISENGILILDEPLIGTLGYSREEINKIIKKERNELKRRIELYRKNKPLPELRNKTVILVDDGIATGVTAKAAIDAVRKSEPENLILAVPVCAYDTLQSFEKQADKIICLHTPLQLGSISSFYENFNQTTDEEVVALLKK